MVNFGSLLCSKKTQTLKVKRQNEVPEKIKNKTK